MPGTRPSLRSSIDGVRRSRFASIAGSILGTHLVTGALGVVFWTVAARGMPAAAVGQLGSATATATMLGGIGMFGGGTLLVSRYQSLPAESRRQLFVAAVVVACVGGLGLGTLFGVGAWLLLPPFEFLVPHGAPFWWLLVTTGLIATGRVFDQAMLVTEQPLFQTASNTAASVVKTVILLLMLLPGPRGVAYALAAWAAGQLVANAMSGGVAWRQTPTTQAVTAWGIRATVARHWREATSHHAVNLALSAPSMLQPVIIAAAISAERNAVFTTARLVGSFAFVAPYAMAMALFASSAGDDRALRRQSRPVFLASLGLSLAICCVVVLGAPAILSVFGGAYPEQGATVLRVFVLACPLLVIKDQYIARARALRQLGQVMRYVFVATGLEITGTLAGAVVLDLMGAIIGWLIALGLGALWIGLRRRP